MDWWELIKQFLPYLFTLLVILFGLAAVIKKIGDAIGATSTATTEAGDFLKSIQDMLADGTITAEELETARKEWTEMVAAGKVAANKWREIFVELLLRAKK